MKSDLGGTIERHWQPLGLTATLRFPVENSGEVQGQDRSAGPHPSRGARIRRG